MSRIDTSVALCLPDVARRAETGSMSLRVEFEGGPADGTVKEYPSLAAALPSLFWSRDEPPVAATYRRLSDEPDPVTGRWRYVVALPTAE